jgi:hypothetical protein
MNDIPITESTKSADVLLDLLGPDAIFGTVTNPQRFFIPAGELDKEPDPNVAQGEALVCGRQGNGIRAIAFKDEDSWKTFAAQNSWATNTTLIWTHQLYVLIIQVKAECPGWLSLGCLFWASDGYALAVDGTASKPPAILQSKPVRETLLSEIIWPNHVEPEFSSYRRAEVYGSPWTMNNRKKRVANRRFWAASIADELGVVFDLTSRQFLRWDPKTSQYVGLEREAVTKMVMTAFDVYSQKEPHEYLAAECTPSRLRVLLNTLKIVSSQAFPDALTAMIQYLERRLERHSNCNVTTKELYRDYKADCHNTKNPVLPEAVFHKESPKIIYTRFSAVKVHNIERDGKAKNGYRGLRLKPMS